MRNPFRSESEMFKLLGWTQNLDHPYPDRGGTLDLRAGDALDLLNGAFDTSAHTVDIRGVGRNRPFSFEHQIGPLNWSQSIHLG